MPRILVFGDDIIRHDVEVPDDNTFSRIKTTLETKGVLMTSCFFGNHRTQDIAVFPRDSKTLEETMALLPC